MSDRILDMQARLQGARQVERELQGLEAQTRRVEEAAGGAAGTERSLTAALGAKNDAAAAAVKSTEKLFSVTDALAGVVGKALGVIGLLNLAWDIGKAIYDAAADSQRELAGDIEAATEAVKAQKQAIDEVIGAAERLAKGGGLNLAELTAEERREARARDLERTENKEKLARLLTQEEDLERRVATARARGAVSAVEGDLERTRAQVEALAFRQRELDLIDQTTAAEARRREGLDREAPRAAAAVAARDPASSLASPFAASTAVQQAQVENELGPERVTEAMAYADGLAQVADQLRALAAAEAEVTEARRIGREMALGYAEASAKAAAAAALGAILRGESVAEAVNAVLQGVAVEATVMAAFEGVKGLAASLNPATAALAAGHYAAAKGFAGVAALATASVLATGGFGGGGGASAASPADATPPGGPQGDRAFGNREAANGGGLTIINNMDLRTRPLATNRELARELTRVQRDYDRLPGSGGAVRRGGGYGV